MIENRDVERVLKQFSETKDAIQELNTLALKEYLFVEEIIGLLQQTTQKNVSPLVLKSIRQRTQRIVKRISRRERLFEKKRVNTWKLLSLLQIELSSSFSSQLSTLLKPIEVSSAFLLKQFSKREGEFIQETMICSDDQNVLLKLLTKAQQIYTFGIQPLLAGIHNLIQWCIEKYPAIQQSLREKYNLTVDLNVVSSLQGRSSITTTIILLDADFVSSMEKKRLAESKTGYLLHFPSGNIIIPEKVLAEMTKIPLSQQNSLISKQTTNYLRSFCVIEKITPQNSEIQTITALWRNTPKGRIATETQIKLFQQSGDITLLVRALRETLNPVLIFSNDNDISATIELFHRQGKALNVSVYRYDSALPGSLRKAA